MTEEEAIDYYVWKFYPQHFTEFEGKVWKAGVIGIKTSTLSRETAAKYQELAGHMGDREVIEALRGGWPKFRSAARKRVMQLPEANVQLHCCPKCGHVLMSPLAQQCLDCGHDWHPRADAQCTSGESQ